MQENWQTTFQTNIWQVHNFLLNSLRGTQSENFNVILSMNTPKQNLNLVYNIIKLYIYQDNLDTHIQTRLQSKNILDVLRCTFKKKHIFIHMNDIL